MWGSRTPCNILLENDCSVHESYDDGHNIQQLCISPESGRYSTEGYPTQDMASGLLLRNSRRESATPDEFFVRNSLSDFQSRGSQPSECAEQYSQCSPVCHNHSRSIHPTENGEQVLQGTLHDLHSKGTQPADYWRQFRQGIVDSIHTKSRRPADVSGYAHQDTKDAWSRSNWRKYSREKPAGTVFSCNDCREPQCLYCWRKSRDAGGDFSFLDGFESQERAWKPGRKIVDQLSDCHHMESSQKSSSRSKSSEEKLRLQTPKWKPSACQSSCAQDEPTWKPANKFCDSHGEYDNKDHHWKMREMPVKEIEWQWPLGKGRGIGPAPAEWHPPFRNHSAQAELLVPPFQRIRGVGALPNSDDWVPPFRGEEQPYSWHRCKGSGGCPPRDQWLAPWCDPSGKEQEDRVYGGRRGHSCSEYPEVNKLFWRGETREVF